MLEAINKDNDVVLLSLLLTLNIFHTFSLCFSIDDFEQVNVCWAADSHVLAT